MKAYKIPRDQWVGNCIGQIGNQYVIIESEQAPEVDYEDITESDLKFQQSALPGKYGTEMAYSQMRFVRTLTSEGYEAPDLIGLLMQAHDDNQTEIAELRAAIIELTGGA